jgi:hypothetical protein
MVSGSPKISPLTISAIRLNGSGVGKFVRGIEVTPLALCFQAIASMPTKLRQ